MVPFRIDWFSLLAVQGNSQESSPSPQFESISSLALSLLHGPTVTAVHDYWKNHMFERMVLTNVEGPGNSDRIMPWTFMNSFSFFFLTGFQKYEDDNDKAQRNDILRRKTREGMSLFLKRQLVNRRNQSHSNQNSSSLIFPASGMNWIQIKAQFRLDKRYDPTIHPIKSLTGGKK